jgi:hypothetical protein
MLKLLMFFVNLCRLHAAPQDLPYSRLLLGVTVLLYALMGFAVSSLEQTSGHALVATLIDVALFAALAFVSLWIIGHTERFIQTFTALTGTGALFNLLGLPIIALLQQVPEGEPSNLSLLLLGLIIWNIVVIGHILRHALNMAMWLASGIALLYVYTSIRVMSALYVAGT